jgi:tetratricopeptide (TPR) repeat protein
LLSLGGCTQHFAEGQALQAQNRWEEAAISYHLAVVDDPDDEEYREALNQVLKVVARDNLDRYREYLAKKQFKKAYLRLQDAARQDSKLATAQAELTKWQRVLIGGQIDFDFEALRADISLADEIALLVRVNTPNPGETIEAEIDLNTGVFFAEDLLYDRPLELQTYYTLNSIGVGLTHARSSSRKFTSREFQRFVDFRTPVVESVNGSLKLNRAQPRTSIATHRLRIDDRSLPLEATQSKKGVRYTLRLEGNQVRVGAAKERPIFTPRYLYINQGDRRIFVDFGRYHVQQTDSGNRWVLARQPIKGADYFSEISKIIALRPYFFYREGVYTFVSENIGS